MSFPILLRHHDISCNLSICIKSLHFSRFSWCFPDAQTALWERTWAIRTFQHLITFKYSKVVIFRFLDEFLDMSPSYWWISLNSPGWGASFERRHLRNDLLCGLRSVHGTGSSSWSLWDLCRQSRQQRPAAIRLVETWRYNFLMLGPRNSLNTRNMWRILGNLKAWLNSESPPNKGEWKQKTRNRKPRSGRWDWQQLKDQIVSWQSWCC